MTAAIYTGPRLCSCGQRAEVVINTGRPDASHTTLLCWRCADGLVGMLEELWGKAEIEEAGNEAS